MFNQVKVIILLTVTAWLAHFFHFRDFGLYEDDYAFISDGMSRDVIYLLEKLEYFISWPQGRPIGFYLASLLSFIGDQLGGLSAIYLVGFFIVSLNSYLFFRILKINFSQTPAVMGALAFCLFPADTTKSLLTHAFILQTSLTFLLVATLCYLSNKKKISYLIIFGSLLSYESAFMVFFGIPLLRRKLNKKIIPELFIHSSILIAFIVVTTGIRHWKSENRVLEMTANFYEVIPIILDSMVVGSKVSLWQFLAAPLSSFSNWTIETYLVFVWCTGIFIFYFNKLEVGIIRTIKVKEYSSLDRITLRHPPLLKFRYQHQLMADYISKSKILLTGVLLLCLGYSVSFTHYPPTAEYGRVTSVHLAATFGGSLVFAWVSSVLLSLAKSYRINSYATTILALYLALVVGYHFTIQLDFKHSWQNQKFFWTSVVKNSPDLQDRTVILVIRKNLPTTKFIKTNSWADPLILRQIYKFPEDWQQEPRLFLVSTKWWSRISFNTDESTWRVPSSTWPGYVDISLGSNVILLKMDGNKLIRLDEPVVIQDKVFIRKEPLSANYKLQKGVLYDYLIDQKRLLSS
jgi:hypothetical protein